MDMLPNIIVDKLTARRPDSLPERPADPRPIPEFRAYSRLSPPRRRRLFTAQVSAPVQPILSPPGPTSKSSSHTPQHASSMSQLTRQSTLPETSLEYAQSGFTKD